MIIQEITVHAGRTFNHPYERSANFRFDFSLKAQLQEGDDFAQYLVTLQRAAEIQADEHKAMILGECERLHKIEDLQYLQRNLKAEQPEWMNEEEPAERAEKLARVETELAQLMALPPYAYAETDKVIHPGHPDHEETTSDFMP